MSLAAVEKAYKAYQDAAHRDKQDKKDKIAYLWDRLNRKFPDGLSSKAVPKETIEKDKDIQKLRSYYNSNDDPHDLSEYKTYLKIRDDEIMKKYVYKLSNDTLARNAMKEISKELHISLSIVQTTVNRRNRNTIPKYNYLLNKNFSRAKIYCTDLEDVKEFCVNNKLDYIAIIDNYGDYTLQKIPSKKFKDLNLSNKFIYEGYLYTKTSNNFFACL